MTAPQVPIPLGSLCTTGGRREMKGAIRVGSRGSTSQSSSCEIWAQRWSGGVTRTSFAQCRSRLASCGATQRSAVLAAREPIFGRYRPQPRTLPSCQYSRTRGPRSRDTSCRIGRHAKTRRLPARRDRAGFDALNPSVFVALGSIIIATSRRQGVLPVGRGALILQQRRHQYQAIKLTTVGSPE